MPLCCHASDRLMPVLPDEVLLDRRGPSGQLDASMFQRPSMPLNQWRPSCEQVYRPSKMPPEGDPWTCVQTLLTIEFWNFWSVNPGPGVWKQLGTDNAHSMQDKDPVLSDFVASQSVGLLGHTETWLTTREASADLAKSVPRISPSKYPEKRRKGEELVCLIHLPTNLPQSVCIPKLVLSLYLVNLSVVSHVSIFPSYIANLVRLILSSMSLLLYWTFTGPLSCMIWYWWGTSYVDTSWSDVTVHSYSGIFWFGSTG